MYSYIVSLSTHTRAHARVHALHSAQCDELAVKVVLTQNAEDMIKNK
jgi:hypothetical protein